MIIRKFLIPTITFLSTFLIGCGAIAFIGAGKQAMEDQMLIEKPAEYPLTGQRVAVVIDTDLTIHYEHPGISTLIAGAVAGRIAKNVENVFNMQYQTISKCV